MKTTHTFSRGNRRCLGCGLQEEFVEFMPSCPAKGKVANADVEREYLFGMEVRSDIPLPEGVVCIAISKNPYDPDFDAKKHAVVVKRFDQDFDTVSRRV